MEEIRIKIKKSEILSIVNLILKLFTIFIFMLGLISNSGDTVIESLIMFVVAIIFDYINNSFFTINDKGIILDDNFTFKWKDIELLSVSKSFIRYKIVNEKIKKIEVSIKEDKMKIEKANKYVDSKLKTTNDEYEIELEKKRHSSYDI